MPLLALGDIHGRDIWKRIIHEHSFDRLVFIGDYFDSKEGIGPERQMENFEEIIALKTQLPEKVILLIGNHDFHYLPGVDEIYSGYQESHHPQIQALLQSALEEDLLQISFRTDDLLFTHAGVTRTWAHNNQIDLSDPSVSMNALFKKDIDAFTFTSGTDDDDSGNEPDQSPIWVRPPSLYKDRIDDFIQIVGHTVQPAIRTVENLIFIDTLGTSGEFLLYQDRAFWAEKAG